MVYDVVPSKHVLKYLRKLKEKKLKQLFLETIFEDIAKQPYSGQRKTGDLAGVWTKGFQYSKVTYRVAYMIEDDKIIPILLCGTHENFYEQLKKLKN